MDRSLVSLHCTVNLAAMDVTLPTLLLLATHLYSPLSVLFTFVMVSCSPSAVKLILLGLAVKFIAVPFMVHEILGQGTPLATHEKVTLDPSIVV